MFSRRAIAALTAALATAACGPGSTDDRTTLTSTSDSAAAGTVPPVGTTASDQLGSSPSSVVPIDLDGLPPESAQRILSDYLNRVQAAVAQAVGDDIYAGSAYGDEVGGPGGLGRDDNRMRITIYGTDAAVVTEVVDRIATDARGRIAVRQTRYSANGMRRFQDEAGKLLYDSGIDAAPGVRWGTDRLEVVLFTPDGEPDAEIARAARSVLGDDIPYVITFSSPLVDF